MILPGAPIFYFIVVVGVFVYFALDGIGKKVSSRGIKKIVKTPAELQEEEFKRQEKVVSLFEHGYTGRCQGEYERYVLWLYQHRDGKRPPTIEEIVEDYRKRREDEKKTREEKRRREWQLFKQSPKYKKELERLEKYLNK